MHTVALYCSLKLISSDDRVSIICSDELVLLILTVNLEYVGIS